ncbi:MAG: DUF6600 domain-containing protein [Bacteroidota bacterium]
MKKYKQIGSLGLFVFLFLSLVTPSTSLAQPEYSASFDTFYDDLAPYGQWINDPNYGSVWVPNVASNFQPYATDGHWVLTEYGNTWVSDYPWGWAVFHYGRWFYQDYYGWAWVPGDEWGPAWVSWRSGGEYYGWAPLAPGCQVNVTINIPSWQWVFVPQIYITSPRIYNYCVPRTRVVHIYHNSMPCDNGYRNNNHLYAYGPQRHEMERATRSRMQVYRIDHMNRPGRSEFRDGSMRMYRPEVAGTWRNNRGNNYNNYASGQSRGNVGDRGYVSDNQANRPYRDDRREGNNADQRGRNWERTSQAGASPQNRNNDAQWSNNRGGRQQSGRRFEQPERQPSTNQNPQAPGGERTQPATPANQPQPSQQPRQQQPQAPQPQQPPVQTQPAPRQESPRPVQPNPGLGRRGPR